VGGGKEHKRGRKDGLRDVLEDKKKNHLRKKGVTS